MQQDSLDPSLSGRGNPADIFGDEGAKAPHLAEQGTALDRVNPDRGALHARRGRLEARESERNQPDNGEPDDRVDRPAHSLLPTIGRSSDIHTYRLLWDGHMDKYHTSYGNAIVTRKTPPGMLSSPIPDSGPEFNWHQ